MKQVNSYCCTACFNDSFCGSILMKMVNLMMIMKMDQLFAVLIQHIIDIYIALIQKN